MTDFALVSFCPIIKYTLFKFSEFYLVLLMGGVMSILDYVKTQSKTLLSPSGTLSSSIPSCANATAIDRWCCSKSHGDVYSNSILIDYNFDVSLTALLLWLLSSFHHTHGSHVHRKPQSISLCTWLIKLNFHTYN